MKWNILFMTSIRALRANPMRSMLTMLGIIIGISSVILMTSIGKGAESLILGQIQGFGSTNIVVEPGRPPSGPSSLTEIFTNSLTMDDVDAILKKQNAPHVTAVAPMVITNARVVWHSEEARTTISGTTPDFMVIRDTPIMIGRNLTDEDVRSRARVVVLGTKVYNDLFRGSDAIGEVVKIKQVNFRVIGVAAQKGTVGFQNMDDRVFIPVTVAQEQIVGIKHVNIVLVAADSDEHIPEVIRDVTLTLRERHHITNPDNDDFHITSQVDAQERVGLVTGILTMLLSAVAAISLVVGGIGIMNIMLVAVTERTREIGLRKAVGARSSDILRQFLLESIILTMVGGVAGIAIGAGISGLIALVANILLGYSWPFVIAPGSVAIAVSVSSVIGIVFGVYPARVAALKDPIEALRYE